MSHQSSRFRRFGNRSSTKALAVPITYLILFVSLIVAVSATYSLAIVKIGARGALLRGSIAKQGMLGLDDAILSVAWSFGASEVVYVDDGGGMFKTVPDGRNLMINLTDGQAFQDVVFNDLVGRCQYQLDQSELDYDDGFYIRGSDLAIINQSSLSITQLYISSSEGAKNIVLCYRPFASVGIIETGGSKPQNLVRLYIIDLASSRSLVASEKFRLKITSLNVTTVTKQYAFNHTISSMALKSILDGRSDTVWLHCVSNANGALVNLEIVTCYVRIQEA